MHSGIQRKNLVLLDISSDVTAFIAQEIPELQEEAAYLQLVTYLKLLKGMDGGFYNYPMGRRKSLAMCRISGPYSPAVGKTCGQDQGEDAAAQQAPVLLGMNWPNEKCTGFESVKSMMNNKLISVIVPVYNVEHYLNRCVGSIPCPDLF